MIRLTRLNHQMVVVNPDNILWADQNPDTILCFVGGGTLIVRETVDEVMERVIKFQRKLRTGLETTQFPRPEAEQR